MKKIIASFVLALSVTGCGAAAAVPHASASAGPTTAAAYPLSGDGSADVITPSWSIHPGYAHSDGTLYIRTLWGNTIPKTDSWGVYYPASITLYDVVGGQYTHMSIGFYVNGVHYVRTVTYHPDGAPAWFSPNAFAGVPFPMKGD
jgi:hypothetical protein